MTRDNPLLLDAYCCKGGAARGYQRAGFHVTGVDIEPQPGYAGDRFIQGDAIEYVREHGHRFDVIHASPPCQADNPLVVGTNGGAGGHVSWLDRTRDVLNRVGVPYVIEQPAGRHSLRRDLKLCGEMFPETRPAWNDHGDLIKYGVQRHRYFELGGWTTSGPHTVHHCRKGHRGRIRGWRYGEYFDGPYVAVYGEGGGKASVIEAQAAMGIDWMNNLCDLAEAIPPAYTCWIGEQFLKGRS